MGVLLSVCSTAASCVASTAYGCATNSCGTYNSTSKQSPFQTRVPYLLLVFVSLLSALIIREWGGTYLINTPLYKLSLCSYPQCAGNQVVLRFSLSLTLFFALMTVCTIPRALSAIHHTCFPAKLILYAGFLALAFFVPESGLLKYAEFSRFAAIMFLILQIMVLVDFAYTWNRNWVDRDRTKFLVGILVSCVVFYVISIVSWAYLFVAFNKPECSFYRALISVSIVFSALVTLTSISDYSPHGALLPSAIVTAYTSYLLYSALRVSASCTAIRDEMTSTPQLIFGFLLATISIVYSSYNLSTSQPQVMDQQDTGYFEIVESDSLKLENEEIVDETNNNLASVDSVIEPASRIPFFHFIMTLASLYSGMLLTSWTSVLTDAPVASAGVRTLWVNILTQWGVFTLYLWTLIAPVVFPDRDFGHYHYDE